MQTSSAKIAHQRLTNEHAPTRKKAPVLSFPNLIGKAGNTVFSGKTAEKEQIRGEDGARTDKNGAKNMTTLLLDLVEEVSQEREKQNKECKELAQKILCNKQIACQLMHCNDEEKGRYAFSIETLINELDQGEEVNVKELTEMLAKRHADLSIRFLRDKAKTLLEQQGILIKKEDNKLRWATLDELQNHRLTVDSLAKTIDSPSTPWQKASAQIKKRIDKRRLKKALADPYLKVNPDGSIERVDIRVTEKMKKLQRERDQAKEEANLIAETKKLKDRKFQSELHQAERDQQIQEQGLMTDARVQVAQIEGQRMINKAKMQSYKPAIAVIVILAIFFFIKSNQINNVQLDQVPVVLTQGAK